MAPRQLLASSAHCIWVRISLNYPLTSHPGPKLISMWLLPGLDFKMTLQQLSFPQGCITHGVHGQVPPGGLVHRAGGTMSSPSWDSASKQAIQRKTEPRVFSLISKAHSFWACTSGPFGEEAGNYEVPVLRVQLFTVSACQRALSSTSHPPRCRPKLNFSTWSPWTASRA